MNYWMQFSLLGPYIFYELHSLRMLFVYCDEVVHWCCQGRCGTPTSLNIEVELDWLFGLNGSCLVALGGGLGFGVCSICGRLAQPVRGGRRTSLQLGQRGVRALGRGGDIRAAVG